MKYTIVLNGIFGLLFVPMVVTAGPIVRSGDSVSVEADQVLEGDFYGMGGTVVVSGEANHDVFITAGSATINAPVKGDITALGGTVQVHAEAGDDVRVMGGEVTLAQPVLGDVVVLGGVLKVLSTASVGGDILFFGGDLTVSGSVQGSVLAYANSVRIDANIGGDVSATVGKTLTLGDRTEILGNLQYESPSELARAQGAVVVGDIQRKTTQSEGSPYYVFLLPVLILLFAALTGYVLFKKHMQILVDETFTSYGTNGLIGLAVLIALPFVAVLLMASVLGMIVGIALLAAYVLLVAVSWVLCSVIIGVLLSHVLTKSKNVKLLSIVLGAVVFSLLPFVPFLGPLAMFAVFAIVSGGLAARLYRVLR